MISFGTLLPVIVTEQLGKEVQAGIRPENIILKAENFSAIHSVQFDVMASENGKRTINLSFSRWLKDNRKKNI